MGVKLMQLPEVPWVRFAGLLSERERLEALEAATIVVVPSPFESLSLLALEAMAVGTPVLVNGHSDVLVEHCRRSQAGLWYNDRDEFVDAAKLLLADDRLRRTDGTQRQGVREARVPLGRDHGQVRPPDRRGAPALVDVRRRRLERVAVRRRRVRRARRLLAARPDVVALDHLVQASSA